VEGGSTWITKLISISPDALTAIERPSRLYWRLRSS
jgi:hypothetical protein